MVGLVGYAQAGKDSVAQTLVTRFHYKRVAFADKLKEMALLIDPPPPKGHLSLKTAVVMHGWEFAKTFPPHRQFLQNLGVAARDVLDPDIWVKSALPEDWTWNPEYQRVVFTDVRFKNEIDFITINGGLIVRIERPGVGPVNRHVSETEWNDVKPVATIINDGNLSQLASKVYDLDKQGVF